MTTVETAAAIVAIIIGLVVAWVKAISGKISNLAYDYVPRPQIDARFQSLEKRLEKELSDQEARTDKRFDTIDSKLDKILDRLDNKADKQ